MSREFFNARALTWDERVAEKDTSRLAAMAGRIDIKPGDTMLDVGTGTGIFVPFCLDKIGSKGRLVCLDYAEKMLEIARSKRFRGNISFICADIEDSGLPGASFDAVVCYSVSPISGINRGRWGRFTGFSSRIALCSSVIPQAGRRSMKFTAVYPKSATMSFRKTTRRGACWPPPDLGISASPIAGTAILSAPASRAVPDP